MSRSLRARIPSTACSCCLDASQGQLQPPVPSVAPAMTAHGGDGGACVAAGPASSAVVTQSSHHPQGPASSAFVTPSHHHPQGSSSSYSCAPALSNCASCYACASPSRLQMVPPHWRLARCDEDHDHRHRNATCAAVCDCVGEHLHRWPKNRPRCDDEHDHRHWNATCAACDCIQEHFPRLPKNCPRPGPKQSPLPTVSTA